MIENIRKTKETEITVKLDIEGTGKSKIDTKINFLNHMLELFAKHGTFNLEIEAKGDLEIDQHHSVEDVGIALGDSKILHARGFVRINSLEPQDEKFDQNLLRTFVDVRTCFD